MAPLSVSITYDYVYRRRRIFYYITNLRIVKFIRKGQFQIKDKYMELKYSDLICIRLSALLHFDLTFYTILPHQSSYISENVTRFPLSKDHKLIEIALDTKQGTKLWGDIQASLVPIIPLVPHPHLKSVLINKKFMRK